MGKNHSFKNKPPKWVTEVNLAILDFLKANPKSYDLGPDLSDLSYKDAEQAIQLYRMHKLFEEPDDLQADHRRTGSLLKMLDNDADGLNTYFRPVNAKTDPYIMSQQYAARNQLREAISSYRFSVSNLEFPSGETLVSAHGDISLYAKLRDIKQLACTEANFDRWAQVAYYVPMIKAAVRRHIDSIFPKGASRKDYRAKSARSWAIALNEVHLDFYQNKVNDIVGPPRFSVIQKIKAKAAFVLFKKRLRHVTTIVDGARLTTVPKSVQEDRVITCEPLCNMIVQRAIEVNVRKIIKDVYDIDLSINQVTHQLLAGDLENATIDLRNASNSVYLAVVEWFIGDTALFRDLCNARSSIVTYSLKNGKEVNEYSWELNMLSPMGNGYTFGIMTLLLLAITRQYDSFSQVFGDDIIVHKDVANDVCDAVRNIGFGINTSKTFVSGYFRESCGAFTSHGRHITSFQLEWAEDAADAVILVNKVGIMAYATNSKLRVKLQKLHTSLLECVPQTLWRGVYYRKNYALRKMLDLREKAVATDTSCVNDSFSLTEGVYVRKSVLQRVDRPTNAKMVTKFHRSKEGESINSLQEPYESFLLLTKLSQCYRRKDGTKWEPRKNVSRAVGWFYIWAGRIMSPTLRDTFVSEKWVTRTPKML